MLKILMNVKQYQAQSKVYPKIKRDQSFVYSASCGASSLHRDVFVSPFPSGRLRRKLVTSPQLLWFPVQPGAVRTEHEFDSIKEIYILRHLKKD